MPTYRQLAPLCAGPDAASTAEEGALRLGSTPDPKDSDDSNGAPSEQGPDNAATSTDPCMAPDPGGGCHAAAHESPESTSGRQRNQPADCITASDRPPVVPQLNADQMAEVLMVMLREQETPPMRICPHSPCGSLGVLRRSPRVAQARLGSLSLSGPRRAVQGWRPTEGRQLCASGSQVCLPGYSPHRCQSTEKLAAALALQLSHQSCTFHTRSCSIPLTPFQRDDFFPAARAGSVVAIATVELPSAGYQLHCFGDRLLALICSIILAAYAIDNCSFCLKRSRAPQDLTRSRRRRRLRCRSLRRQWRRPWAASWHFEARLQEVESALRLAQELWLSEKVPFVLRLRQGCRRGCCVGLKVNGVAAVFKRQLLFSTGSDVHLIFATCAELPHGCWNGLSSSPLTGEPG